MTKIYHYYSLEDAIHSAIEGDQPFILANEKIKKDKDVGRYYTVFPSYEAFRKHRKKFPHCHEIVVDHKKAIPNPGGRLVFDFDLKLPSEKGPIVPKNFKTIVQDIILKTIEYYYTNINIEIIDFVWSSSTNPHKISKHLTVKNFCFDDWVTMSKIFYRLFAKVWNESEKWIHSEKLFDIQIVRNRASLRMVGSTKILDGYPLNLDKETHSLEDSLIRLYTSKTRKEEQIITRQNLAPISFNDISIDSLSITEEMDADSHRHTLVISSRHRNENPIYQEDIYDKAFKMCNKFVPGDFSKGRITGSVLHLMRIKKNKRENKSKCLMSGKQHDNDNAFCIINNDQGNYIVWFGCFRFCSRRKTIYLGTIMKLGKPMYNEDLLDYLEDRKKNKY